MVDPLFALTVFAGSVTLLVVIFWPRKGIYARLSQNLRVTKQVQIEDALKHFICGSKLVGHRPWKVLRVG